MYIYDHIWVYTYTLKPPLWNTIAVNPVHHSQAHVISFLAIYKMTFLPASFHSKDGSLRQGFEKGSCQAIEVRRRTGIERVVPVLLPEVAESPGQAQLATCLPGSSRYRKNTQRVPRHHQAVFGPTQEIYYSRS